MNPLAWWRRKRAEIKAHNDRIECDLDYLRSLPPGERYWGDRDERR